MSDLLKSATSLTDLDIADSADIPALSGEEASVGLVQIEGIELPDSDGGGTDLGNMFDDMGGGTSTFDLAAGDLASPLPNASITTSANYLLQGFWDFFGGDFYRSFNMSGAGTAAKNGTIHYNYSGFSGISGAGTDTDGLTAARRALVDDALDYIGETLGINFVLTASTDTAVVDLWFKDNASGAFANSDLAGSGNGSANHRFIDYSWVNINSTWSGSTSDINDYTYQTFIHEIFHALGLGHQGAYNGTANYVTDTTSPNFGNNSNVFLNDSWQMSIMSYMDMIDNTTVLGDNAYVITGMASDWQALRAYYGSSAFTGDTVYGFNTNISALTSEVMADLALYADLTMFSIIDDGGTDTVDFSGYGVDQTIDLAIASGGSTTGTRSSIGGLLYNMQLAVGTVIENAVSGIGNDTLYGNSAANSFEGGDGSDTMYTYGGNDTFVYRNGLDGDTDGIYGGTDHDRILLTGAGYYDHRNINVDSIEEIEFDAESTVDKTIAISNKELDQTDEFSTSLLIDGNANTDANDTVEVHLDFTNNVDISGWTFQDWNTVSGTQDYIRIYGSVSANTVTATTQMDWIYAYGGNDTVYAGGGNDYVEGGDNDDNLFGGADDDSLLGGAGNDWIYWEGGTDYHDGGTGVDTISGNGTTFGSLAVFNLGSGIYTTGVFTETWINFENYFNNGTGDETVRGSSGDNLIETGSGDNTIFGLGGTDTIYGGGGNDVLIGGFVTDDVYGGDGDDTLRVLDGEFYDNNYGGTGTDTLDHSASTYSGSIFDFSLGTITGTGINPASAVLSSIEIYQDGSGDNTIISSGSSHTYYGNDGNDTMIAIGGGETMYGGAGVDTLDLTRGDYVYTLDMNTGVPVEYSFFELFLEFENVMFGGNNDTVTGTGEDNSLSMGLGNDTAYGGAGEDTIDLGGGDDIANGGTFVDTIYGGIGNDTFFITGGDFIDIIDGGDDIDTLDLSGYNVVGVIMDLAAGTYQTTAGFEGVQSIVNVEIVRGSTLGDSIGGTAGLDTIYGGFGNDTLSGRNGIDLLYGGEDNDLMIGGIGADELDGGNGIDTSDYSASNAKVTVNLTTGLGAGGHAYGDTLISIEGVIGSDFNDKLTGTDFADTLVGGAGVDNIVGKAGNDTIDAGDGADRIQGGLDIDTMTGGLGNDNFIYNSLGGGNDIITDFTFAAGNNDRFEFKGSIFGGLAAGAIAANQWQSDASNVALTGDVRFLYETDTGILRYDFNGSAAGGVFVIATLQAGATMNIGDIFIV